MEHQTLSEACTVAIRLRPVIYVYAVVNIAVAALLLSTVTPAPPTPVEQRLEVHEGASL